jgi:hypothetical protein
MSKNKRFKELLDEGISSVARRQVKSIDAIELALGEQTGYSKATVQHWRRGNMPPDRERIEHIVHYCVENGRVDKVWATALLTQAGYSNHEALLTKLFPSDQNNRASQSTLQSNAQEYPPFQRVEMSEGVVDLQSSFYITRSSDEIAQAVIGEQGVTITIKGTRQVGKSSLLARLIMRAQTLGKRVVLLNFQLLKPFLEDPNLFFKQFCVVFSHKLGITEQVEAYWKVPLANAFCCTEYVGSYLLNQLSQPVLLAIDEADIIFESKFRTDFFAMLRTWHNNRAFDPIWKQLDLVLVTSTEPYYFIDNLNQSPFNVGEVIELQDFTSQQISHLNTLYGSPLTKEDERQLMALLNGHPYLIRRAFYLIASGRITMADLLAHASDERGPFGEHLRTLLLQLNERALLMKDLRQVIYQQTCPDEKSFFRLRGAGVVRREKQVVLPRCALYAEFFRNHFQNNHVE